MELADLKIIVTGAASGMGAYFARQLAAAGARVAAGDVMQHVSTNLDAPRYEDIHACEDALLLSIGRYLPVPAPFMYIIGIALSTILLSFIARRIARD